MAKVGNQKTLAWGMGRYPMVARPLAPYIGGKRNLSATVCSRIQTIEHSVYAEVFFGMGGIFFRRPNPTRIEVINDINSDVITLLRIAQRHNEALCDMIKFHVAARSEFERLLEIDPESLTDLERAARFLFLQRTSFGGRLNGRSFGVSRTSPSRFNSLDVRCALESVQDRLRHVVLECLPWQAFIQRYDHKAILFYLDPPYWGFEDCYGKDLFSRSDFFTLSEVLQSIKGKFLLSINDLPQVRKMFAWANIQGVRTSYSLSSTGRRTAVKELLISAEG